MAAFFWKRPRPGAGEAFPAPQAQATEAERWQTLLDATEDAIFVVDTRGRIVQSNRIADRLFASPAPRPHRPLAETLGSAIEEVYRDAVRHGVAREAEVSLSSPLPRTLHARVTPVSAGEFLIVLRDLTELRRLERVRRDFVANVSHELRTPLTSIKAMTETLLDGARLDEAVAPRFLQTIIHESDRLVRLSSDLLDLSRAESGRVERSRVDLTALTQDVASRLAAQSQKAGVTLTNTLHSPLIVTADPDELAQVLVNLLDNAIAYTPRDGSVTLAASETPGAVTVTVADTGIGIQAHDIPRLFERFYRVDKARSRASGGTGLGLSIVKHIVESHGGTVSVDSEYNKGSVFTFTLPKN